MKLVHLPFKSTQNRVEYCRVGNGMCKGLRLIGSLWLVIPTWGAK